MEQKPWAILSDPFRNKGTAFSDKERTAYQLHGRLPIHVSTLEEQIERRYVNFKMQQSDLSKHLFLSDLYTRNTTLFYKLLSEHLTEMLPFIYTPVVGEFSEQFSTLYTHPHGLFLSYPQRDKLSHIINSLDPNIDIIVVTDGERILGLGDLGAGGMAISIGKLHLYTLFGGIHPAKTLPILLDVGTDNPALLNDPLYLGWRSPRLRGQAYDAFIDQFISAIRTKFPHAILQWEDFGKETALPLLDRYRKKLPSFNDDIQGTAAVVLAALYSAAKRVNIPLKDQKIVLFGGGSAGTGILTVLASQGAKNLYVVDIDGLVHTGMPTIPPHQRPFARPAAEVAAWNAKGRISLLDAIKHIRPTTLIGVSAQSGAFTQEVITTLAQGAEQPIIFPLSNPTSKSEADPKDLLAWTEGKAIIATGSPFAPVSYKGKLHSIAQCNNVFIFPGIGLGAIAAQAREITDTMFYKAAEILSDHAPPDALFPPFEKLRDISRLIALAVMEVAGKKGIGERLDPKMSEERLDALMWSPVYA